MDLLDDVGIGLLRLTKLTLEPPSATIPGDVKQRVSPGKLEPTKLTQEGKRDG